MPAHEQRLRDERLQATMRLLGDAVFMRAARRDPTRAQPVVIEDRAKAGRQIAPTTGFQLVGRGRQIVAAQDVGHAAERPQRPLDAGHQRLKRFAEGHRHPRPVAVTEHELKEQVRERIAGDRHAQVGPVREVDRRLATRDGDLLEEHLGLGAMLRPPLAKPPLQRPRLARMKLLRVARAQQLQHQLRFEHAFGVTPQQGLDVRVPHRRKGIRTRPPIPELFGGRRRRTRVPFPRGPQTHAAGGRCGRLGLAIHTFLPHEPNLRIRDH